MKKLLIWAFLIFIGLNVKNVDAMLERHKPNFGYYVGETHFYLTLLEDLETHKPVFPLSYEHEYDDTHEFQETDKVDLTAEELQTIKDYIFYIIGDRSYGECTISELIGIQALIWEIYATKTDVPLRWTCDVGYLVNYREWIKERKRAYETPRIYNYLTTENQPLKINFMPFFTEEYQLVDASKNFEIIRNDDSFEVTSKVPSKYTLGLESPYFEEEIGYFASSTTELIELKKMAKTKPIIHVEVAENSSSFYAIQLALDEGITLSTDKEIYLKGERVKLNYNLAESYSLQEIKITTLTGKQIVIKDNEFLMPDENVIIHAMTKKKEIVNQKFTITMQQVEGITYYSKEKEQSGEQVIFHYNLKDDYELEYFLLQTASGQEIKLTTCSFIMPNENVTLIPVVKKKESILPNENEEEENKETLKIPNTFQNQAINPYLLSIYLLNYIEYAENAKKCKKYVNIKRKLLK